MCNKEMCKYVVFEKVLRLIFQSDSLLYYKRANLTVICLLLLSNFALTLVSSTGAGSCTLSMARWGSPDAEPIQLLELEAAGGANLSSRNHCDASCPSTWMTSMSTSEAFSVDGR